MAAYLIRRLLLLIPVVLGVLTLVFLMRALVPGDPIEIMFLGQMPPDPETVADIRRELGLDVPLPMQYVRYVAGAVQGDLGTSIRTRRPVLREIADRYPKTLLLTGASLLVALVVGLTTGILAAVYKDTAIDFITMLLALAGLSMPAFWFGLLMIQFFGVQLRWFPVMGAGSLRHLVLPALTLGLIASTVQARVARSSMLEVLNSDYIRTARAKGLRGRIVVLRHGLKNALIPTLTILGLQVGGLLGGAFIIETVFAWQGVGQLAVQAITQRDFPLIQGIIAVVATTYVLVNLLVDIAYRLVDPRISYE
ncbi:MAG: peptide ABC transporter permease [Chloroflexi bacterium]|nr:MAG: peptide ABC transporter permease [Chloroflexota bacterium]